MSGHYLHLTETRATWLSKIHAGNEWKRDNCITFNWRTNAKMPEPVYQWLIENALIDCDCGVLNATERGISALKLVRLLK